MKEFNLLRAGIVSAKPFERLVRYQNGQVGKWLLKRFSEVASDSEKVICPLAFIKLVLAAKIKCQA